MTPRLWRFREPGEGGGFVDLRIDGDRFELSVGIGGSWGSSNTRFRGTVEGDGRERVLAAAEEGEFRYAAVDTEPTEELRPSTRRIPATWLEDGRVGIVLDGRRVELSLLV